MKMQKKLVYSPRIRESLIPRIREVAQSQKKHMTEIVNSILEKELEKLLPATGPLDEKQ